MCGVACRWRGGAAAGVAAAGAAGADAGVVAGAAAAGLLSWASATGADPARGRRTAPSNKTRTHRAIFLPKNGSSTDLQWIASPRGPRDQASPSKIKIRAKEIAATPGWRGNRRSAHQQATPAARSPARRLRLARIAAARAHKACAVGGFRPALRVGPASISSASSVTSLKPLGGITAIARASTASSQAGRSGRRRDKFFWRRAPWRADGVDDCRKGYSPVKARNIVTPTA